MQEFITPPNHKGFSAKKLFDENGKIKWGAIAYIEKGGGGPEGNHTHNDNHIFIVVDGEAKVILDDKEVIVKKNESFFVDGTVPHSIWNNADQTTVVIKISTERETKHIIVSSSRKTVIGFPVIFCHLCIQFLPLSSYTITETHIQTRKLRAVSVFVSYPPFFNSIFRQTNTPFSQNRQYPTPFYLSALYYHGNP